MSASSGRTPWQPTGDDGGLRNFGYVIDGKLAGLAHPGYGGGLDAALDALRSRGITGLVSLDEVGIAADIAHEHGLAHRHIPINDFEPPTLAQADAFVSFVDDQLEQGGQVAAHCQAGIGRTGTMLAAYVIAHGSSVDEAIDAVRRRRPHSVESDGQRRFLQDYARHCQSRRG
jgi:atypical dual specificity phosphatase